MLSRPTQYAVSALGYLAIQPVGKLATAEDIAADAKIPLPYLWKLLKVLVDQGIVRSHKGMKGGYQLRRPARAITLSDVIAAIESEAQARLCLLIGLQCDLEKPCPLHREWERLWSRLDKTTLVDFVAVGVK